MASYTVSSEILAGKNIGDTISDLELEGCNIEALLAAGHLVETPTKKTDKE